MLVNILTFSILGHAKAFYFYNVISSMLSNNARLPEIILHLAIFEFEGKFYWKERRTNLYFD